MRPRPRGRAWALAAAAVVAGCTLARAEPLASPGCLDGGEAAVVQDVEPGLDLRLVDGRHVRLAGLAIADDPAGGALAAARVRHWLAGRPVRVAAFGTAPDRWGRTSALVFATDGGDGRPVSVGEALLDAGLARARPSADVAPCWGAYLGLEIGARTAHRGLWSGDGVLASDDSAALQANLGRFVIVEGRINGVFEGRSRTYLRFAGGFAASLERRTIRRFASAAMAPETWVHRRLRIRGLLDDRWGSQIEVTDPEQIEVLVP